MAWVLLVVAGLLEVGWSVGMKYTDGFTRLVPSLLTGAGIVTSMLLLSYAVYYVGVLACYVGLLASIPVALVMLAHSYRALSGDVVTP